MDVILNIAIGISLILVLATFIIGMFAFSQYGEKAGALSNRMMVWRVRTQIVAVAILALGMLIKSQHG